VSDPRTIIASNLERLEQLDSGVEGVDRDDALELFFDGTFDLGVTLHQAPDAVPADELTEYRERMAEIVDRFHHRVEMYVNRTVRKFLPAFEANEWRDLCRRRSALAFLQELSEGTSYGLRALTIDLGELDELILDVGEREGYLDPDKVPEGVPGDHWWWWYPNSPPDDS
jgi:hypothetical protein